MNKYLNKTIKTIIFMITVFVLGLNISNLIPNSEYFNSTKAIAKTEPKQMPQAAQKPCVSVEPLDLIATPEKYVGKRVKITGFFDKFSILGLDYTPALKSSEKYIGFLIQRPNVDHDIPLSELKNFLERKQAEKFIDLNNGDKIEYTGTVFSSALGDAWVDVDNLTVVEKKKTDKKN